LGDPVKKSPSLLDLSPDHKVSRLHGRIWHENGFCWIEDLNSGRGTLLNNVEIKGQGKKRIQAGDVIVAGIPPSSIESPDPPITAQTNFLEAGTSLLPDERPRKLTDQSSMSWMPPHSTLGNSSGNGLILPTRDIRRRAL